MPKGDNTRKVTDAEIIEAWKTNASITELAMKFDMAERTLRHRIKGLRAKGFALESFDVRSKYYVHADNPWHWQNLDKHPGVIQLDIQDGVVLIGSDSHYWPGIISTAHRGFVHFCEKLDPKIVIKNGDELDFPRLSRYAPIGWENRPEVVNEIEAAQERLGEIERAAPNAIKCWTCGNHDARFESKLANTAPEYARVHGVHLKDHFPMWRPCWTVQLNKDTVVKHRFRGGIHAPHNNTMWAGKSIFTGHLHSLKVMPLSDLNGTRWGVDCGTMADPYGPQFYNYTEINPVNWRSGFVVLTFIGGQLLWPEIAFVRSEGVIDFRGELIHV